MIKTPSSLSQRRRQALAGIGLLLALAPLPGFASAVAADPLIEGARLCTQYFPVEEKKNTIPTHLLAAIATTESGRWHDGLGMSVPWPWTINVEGKGYYFDSKAEAIAQTQKLLAAGKQSIDVGCMQVNLKHHPKAFSDLNQAFEPSKNVAYAAKFLHDNYADLGDWIKATAAYHSRTPEHGNRYLGNIERSWNRIVAKVAAARGSKTGGAATTNVAAASSALTFREPLPRVVSSARPMQPAQRARVISVNDSARKSSNILVVRATAPAAPKVESKPVALADATPAPAPAPVVAASAPAVDSVRRVSLDTNAAGAVSQANGPKFVFAN